MFEDVLGSSLPLKYWLTRISKGFALLQGIKPQKLNCQGGKSPRNVLTFSRGGIAIANRCRLEYKWVGFEVGLFTYLGTYPLSSLDQNQMAILWITNLGIWISLQFDTFLKNSRRRFAQCDGVDFKMTILPILPSFNNICVLIMLTFESNFSQVTKNFVCQI